MTIHHTSHARYDLWYHIAWVTKYRKQVFTDQRTQEKVQDIIRAIAGHYDMTIGVIECLEDHIHLTFSAPPRIAPAEAAQILKSVSTKKLFETFSWLSSHFWGGEIWAGGYFIRSIGEGLTKRQIEQYIKEQSEEF
jgi:putative transposase